MCESIWTRVVFSLEDMIFALGHNSHYLKANYIYLSLYLFVLLIFNVYPIAFVPCLALIIYVKFVAQIMPFYPFTYFMSLK